MGVAGQRMELMRAGAFEQGGGGATDFVRLRGQSVLLPQPHRSQYLIIAAAAGVQPFGRIAQPLRQQ